MSTKAHGETPGGRTRLTGKPISRMLTAAVLSAAVVFLPDSFAQGQSERIPAGPANMFKPGAVFLYHDRTADLARIEGLNAAINTMTAQSAEATATI